MNTEGYVYFCYGALRYLEHVVASVVSLRRYDRERPVALFCSERQRDELEALGLDVLFDVLEVLPEEHQSVIGFKHHLDRFMPFDRNLYIDADTIWCRDPSPLWSQLSAFGLTSTGIERADMWFGAAKNGRILLDYLLDRRRRTLRRFGLTNLPRVQSGLMFAQDAELTRLVCESARWFKLQEADTHFTSRRLETGRSEESCEWSLAMAFSLHRVPVYPWFQNHNSPQLDFVEDFARYDPDFHSVSCYYPCDRLIFSFRGVPSDRLRRWLVRLFSSLPGRGDFIWVTPYVLHFAWLRHKRPFQEFALRTWRRLAGSADRSTVHLPAVEVAEAPTV